MESPLVVSTKNPAANYLLSLQSGPSRQSQRSALDMAARIISPGNQAVTFEWRKMNHEMMLHLRSILSETLAPASANRTMSAVKQVCREAWRMRLLDADELQRICDVKGVKGSRLKAGRCVEADELRALFVFAHAQPKRKATRDAALLHVLFFGGLRRAEVAKLQTNQLKFEGKRVVIRVIGKGNKERAVPLPLTSTDAVSMWLNMLGSDGPLFPNKWGESMDGENVYYIVTNLAKMAGLPHLTPHDGRRTFISYLLDADADISAIQALAGHAHVQTTVSYDRRPERGKAKAVDKLPHF